MRSDGQRFRLLSRRAAILGAGKAALLAVLVGRMYQLQIVESERFRTLARENRISVRLLAPSRGLIVDRHGRPLARNLELYRVKLAAYGPVDVMRTLERLGSLVSVGDDARRRVLREIQHYYGHGSVTVYESLDWTDVAKIEVNAPDLSGVSVELGETRNYPYGKNTSHLVGYVSVVSERERRGTPSLMLSQLLTGKRGIEAIYERSLRGQPGNSEVEVNSLGRVIRELGRQEPRAGADVRIALDLDLQLLATERLSKERSAAAVLMDVENGEVLVQASVPGYDPNEFVSGLSPGAWEQVVNDPMRPLVDRTIAGAYAPGSTFKMVVALAALEGGIVGKEHRVFCRGHVDLGRHRFHCWKKGGHSWMDMVAAIQNSCDVYFYDLAKRLGPDRIAAMARRLGFGVRTGIGLAGERQGIVPSTAWKKKNRNEPWYRGETFNYGIGQGYLLATPLQLAVMTARIANAHEAVTPRLLRLSQEETWKSDFEELGISSASLSVVRKAMFRVCNAQGGTAYRARIREKGMEMSGKTGTSQVRRISRSERVTGVRKNKDRPWEERDHSLFVGYAPSDHPKYAVSVIVEHGGSGSAVAAPIAREILLAAQKRRALRLQGPLPGVPRDREDI